jgi:hypothetical protein
MMTANDLRPQVKMYPKDEKEVRAFLENPELPDKILRELNSICYLPNEGVVCGGAVGNIIMNMIYNINAPINDVYIFITNEIHIEGVYDIYAYCETVYSENISFSNEYNIDRLAIGSKADYRILRVLYNGKANYIIVDVSFSTMNFAYEIISHFDFNSVQVGIDLKTKTLVYTNWFVSFLSSLQLQIIYATNVGSSLPRLFNKVLENPYLYCNIEDEIDKLAFASKYFNFRVTEISVNKYPEAKKYCEQYGRYIDISTSTNYYELQRTNLLYFEFNEEVLDRVKDKEIKVAELIKSLSKSLRIDEFGNQYLNIFLYNIIYDNTLSKYLRDNIIEACWKYPLFTFSFIRDRYHYPEIKQATLKKVNAFFKEHSGLLRNVGFFTVPHFIEYYEFLQELLREYGLIAIGIIESNNIKVNSHIEFMAAARKLIEKEIASFKKTSVISLPERIINTISKETNTIIKEMDDGAKMLLEGVRQHHCVAGYTGELGKGSSRFFTILNKDAIRSTIQFIVRLYKIEANKLPEIMKIIYPAYHHIMNNMQDSQEFKYAKNILENEIISTSDITLTELRNLYPECFNIFYHENAYYIARYKENQHRLKYNGTVTQEDLLLAAHLLSKALNGFSSSLLMQISNICYELDPKNSDHRNKLITLNYGNLTANIEIERDNFISQKQIAN